MATLSPAQTELNLDRLLQTRTVLVLPGWNGSGPTHWQTVWERKYPAIRRVEQRSWAQPQLEDWTAGLSAYVYSAAQPVVLVAHSLACVAVAHWASRESSLAKKVEVALLVAPADVDDCSRCPSELRSFAPIPDIRLPFPSTLIASEDDPYMCLTRARRLAESWGSTFLNAGRVGHINCNSGHGPWPEGEDYLLHAITEHKVCC